MCSLFLKLKEKNRLNPLFLFTFTTILCIGMVAFRMHITSGITFSFLVWNIFLALVPYGVSTLIVLYHEKIKKRWLLLLPFVIWLSFFPNAPYILTDLFHLKPRAGVPYWFDLSLILFFAWNGLMLGYASLLDIQYVLTRRFTAWMGWMVSVISLILGGFGIYLGRYLRWNSWDIISSPGGLFNDIFDRLVDPRAHPQTYGVTILFSLFLVVGYLMLVQFSKTAKELATQ